MVIDPDSIVTLCKELSYLDIPGSTMKSRLVVDIDLIFGKNASGSCEEETMVIEECLMMGTNKFVIQEERLKLFREILLRHGKSLHVRNEN